MRNDRYKAGQGGEDPVFSLPIENEILIMKLRAEFGAECSSAGADIPPVVINEFLKSVYDFEQKFSCSTVTVPIYEKIGRPFFPKASELNADELCKELERAESLLEQHGIQLDILGEYPKRTIYTFITEEFFLVEMDDIALPRYIHHFCYEAFHPNHEMEIRDLSVTFLTQWFQQKINEYNNQFGDLFIHPDTRKFPKEKILKKIQYVFDAYVSFTECGYSINEVRFEWDDNIGSGIGHAEGFVRYDAVAESGELIHFEGPFKIYLSNNGEWWSIFYFVFPGFSWNE